MSGLAMDLDSMKALLAKAEKLNEILQHAGEWLLRQNAQGLGPGERRGEVHPGRALGRCQLLRLLAGWQDCRQR